MKVSPEMSSLNINEIVSTSLCIGCGFCSVVCPELAITMVWQNRRTWQPEIDEEKCTDCGRCRKVCPHTPQCIVKYAATAQSYGEKFGLPQDGTYFIAYDKDNSRRIRSSSGGVTTALLEHLLSSNAVDGILASLPLEGTMGEPHFQMNIFWSVRELDRGRSSHYHPLCYDNVLNKLRESDGCFAVVGVPCVIRGLVRLPSQIQEKIKYKICLVCGKNVTGAFSDCLAAKEGVEHDDLWRVSLRNKEGIPDASNYNNLFELPHRKICRNRFETAFTDMWRNYFFTPECCLYCPDFYGVDADVSVKDAWGRLSVDPLGTSLVIVNNSEIEGHLLRLKNDNRLVLEKCDSDEVFNSQTATPIFKHKKIRDRVVWKKNIAQELNKNYQSLGWFRRWLSQDSHEYWRLWLLMKLSNYFYFKFGKVPVNFLLFLVLPLQRKWPQLQKNNMKLSLKKGIRMIATLVNKTKRTLR